MSITDPRDISGLVLWLSAEQIVGLSDNTQITAAWPDQSGNGNDGTPVGTVKPKWRSTLGQGGGAAVEFPNDGYFTFGNVMAGATAGEIMATIKHDTGDTGLWSFSADAGNSDECHYPFTGIVYEHFGKPTGGRRSFTPSVAISSWRRYNVWSAASDWAALLDETSQDTTVSNTPSWGTTAIIGAGRKNAAVDLRFRGWFGCVVVYNRKLTTGERADLAAWLTANPSGQNTGSALTTSTTDNAGLTDSISTVAGGGTTVTDSAGLSDSVSVQLLKAVTATDSAGTVDSAVPYHPSVDVTDSTGLTDDVTAILYSDTPSDNPDYDPVDDPVTGLTDPPGLSGTADTTDTPPALEPVPTGVEAPQLVRESEVYPTPTLDGDGWPDPDAWLPTSVVTQDYGRYQVVIGGVDRTYFRDVPIVVGEYTKNEPFSDNLLTLHLPQVTIFERTGAGALSWLKAGVSVEVHRRTEGGYRKVRFEGFVPAFHAFERGRDGGLEVRVLGALYEMDLEPHRPSFYVDEYDVDTRIIEAVKNCPSRHFVQPAGVSMGIPTRKRGDSSQSVLAYIRDLLALATTADGLNQWTMGKTPGRRAVLHLKDVTTVDWTVSAGAPGIEIDIDQDWTGAWNVIFGEGTAPDGCTWRNAKFPNLRPDDAPIYPYGDPDQVITIGTAGEEVRLWQQEMTDHGYSLDVDGYYGTEDAYQCRLLQRRAGILIDGIVGPQTWAATFDVGADAGDLDGAYIAPIAWRKEVEPFLHNARGEVIGDNPDYDPNIVRVGRYVNFGDGVTKRDATRQSWADIRRFATPGWMGEITLSRDPEEGSRWDIDEGENIRLRYFEGHGATGLLFHISGVQANPEQGTVKLTVDTKARDLMAITAIRQRDREALAPAFDQLGNRPARSVRDVATWDCENGSGIIPRHAIYGGLWTVLRIPAGRLGQIARTAFTTDTPHAKFAVGVFSKPVTAADLLDLVGNPLTTSKAWTAGYDALVDAGWLIAWGDKDQPAGYFPGLGSDDDPLTGRLVDDQLWAYESNNPPWLWIAEFSDTSCFIKGRLHQAILNDL